MTEEFKMRVVGSPDGLERRSGRKAFPVRDQAMAFAKANPGRWCLVFESSDKTCYSWSGNWQRALRNAGVDFFTFASRVAKSDTGADIYRVYCRYDPPAATSDNSKKS